MKDAPAALALLVGIQAALWTQAVSLDDALAEMEVSLDLPQNIEMLPVEYQGEVEYQLAFRIIGAGYVVRIGLVPESALVRYSGGGDVDRYVPLFSMGVLAAMAKDSLYFSKTAELPGPTVSREFGADSGMTALVRGNKSGFGKGFAYIAVAFLYKVGKGVVVVSFLYNDAKDLKTDSLDFSQAYYCFRFRESSPKQ